MIETYNTIYESIRLLEVWTLPLMKTVYQDGYGSQTAIDNCIKAINNLKSLLPTSYIYNELELSELKWGDTVLQIPFCRKSFKLNNPWFNEGEQT